MNDCYESSRPAEMPSGSSGPSFASLLHRRANTHMIGLRLTRRAGTRLATVLLATGTVAFDAPVASAARQAMGVERDRIVAVALGHCETTTSSLPNYTPCASRGEPLVSTDDERFAWAPVVGETYSGTLLQRSTSDGDDFRVIASRGGGQAACAAWWSAAPRAVVADLALPGIIGHTGAFFFNRCPERRLPLRRCGRIPVISEGVRGHTRITARGVTCRFARRTIRNNSQRGVVPRGWDCYGSGEGALCVRGRGRAMDAIDDPGVLPYIPNVHSRN